MGRNNTLVIPIIKQCCQTWSIITIEQHFKVLWLKHFFPIYNYVKLNRLNYCKKKHLTFLIKKGVLNIPKLHKKII